jgi:hypothetical protein
MKKRLEMDRMFVDCAPKPAYTATAACVVTIWCLPNLEVEQDEKAEFSHIYVGFSPEATTVDHGTPLPEDHPVDVPLAAGETIYAVTTDYAYLGYVAVSEE